MWVWALCRALAIWILEERDVFSSLLQVVKFFLGAMQVYIQQPLNVLNKEGTENWMSLSFHILLFRSDFVSEEMSFFIPASHHILLLFLLLYFEAPGTLSCRFASFFRASPMEVQIASEKLFYTICKREIVQEMKSLALREALYLHGFS
jgi:hypothetical protein